MQSPGHRSSWRSRWTKRMAWGAKTLTILNDHYKLKASGFISDTWKSLSKQSLETGRMRRPTSRGLRRTSQHSVFRYGACSRCVSLKDLEWKLRWLHTVVELAQTCSNCLINYKGSPSTMLNYFPLTAAVILHRTWSFWRSCSSAKCSLYWCKSFKTWSSMSGNSRSTTQLGPACQHDEEAHDHLSIFLQGAGNDCWAQNPSV